MDLGIVTILISSLREYLASSNLIEQFTKVNELCEKCDIPSTTTRKRTRKPSRRLDDFIASKTTGQRLFEGLLKQSCMHHISVFYKILDCLIRELDRRFSKKSCKIFNGIAALFSKQQSFLCEKDLIQFAVAYSINLDDLECKVSLIKKLLTKEPQQQPKTIVQFLSLLL